jgi:hypothetical protein
VEAASRRFIFLESAKRREVALPDEEWKRRHAA